MRECGSRLKAGENVIFLLPYPRLCSQVSELLSAALAPRTAKSGRPLPRRQIPERTARIADAVLTACAEAHLDEAELGGAPELWRRARELGLWAPTPTPQLERTLALLKPDCVEAGKAAEVKALILAEGFEIVRDRRWRMDPSEAADFLATSWGSSSGDRERRFFAEMVNRASGFFQNELMPSFKNSGGSSVVREGVLRLIKQWQHARLKKHMGHELFAARSTSTVAVT